MENLLENEYIVFIIHSILYLATAFYFVLHWKNRLPVVSQKHQCKL